MTVTAPQGITTDGLDTTVAVLGPRRGLKLIEETPGAAVMFVRKTDGKEEVFRTKNFKEHSRKP